MGRRNIRRSKKRLNSILMMLLLSATLLVLSTYAWFSSNRVVTIEGISAQVSAASGIQISLDGENWGTRVTVNQSALAALTTGESPNQVVKNRYQWPTKLSPVSTDGSISSNDVAFYYGTLSPDGTALTGVAAEGPDVGANGKYIAFDIYLKNTTGVDAGNNLLLGQNSSIAIDTANGGQANTGLEYSARVGLLLYDTSGGVALSSDGTSVRAIPIGSNPKVSIWEPNYNVHIGSVVTNDARITSAASTFQTLGLTSGAVTQDTLSNINSSALPVTDDQTTTVDESAAFAVPSTVRTAGTVSADTPMTDVSTTPVQLVLAKDKIMKARMYIWLEGQDPDCNDTASTGKALTFLINLSKPTE